MCRSDALARDRIISNRAGLRRIEGRVMTTVDITSAQKDLHKLVRQALAGEIVTISSEEGSIVVMPEEEWESVKETLYLLGGPDFMKDVADARNAPAEEREAWNRDASGSSSNDCVTGDIRTRGRRR